MLGNPDDLVVTASGDIFAVCGEPSSVVKINPLTGNQTLVASGGSLGSNPEGIALAPNGDLLVADYHAFGGHGVLLRINPSNGNQSVVSNYGYFEEPARVAV